MGVLALEFVEDDMITNKVLFHANDPPLLIIVSFMVRKYVGSLWTKDLELT